MAVAGSAKILDADPLFAVLLIPMATALLIWIHCLKAMSAFASRGHFLKVRGVILRTKLINHILILEYNENKKT